MAELRGDLELGKRGETCGTQWLTVPEHDKSFRFVWESKGDQPEQR